MSRWTKVKWNSRSEKWLLPDFEGVYAIYLDEHLMYIGQSLRICKRIKSHMTGTLHGVVYDMGWGQGVDVHIKFRLAKSVGEGLMAERKLILRLNPEGNATKEGDKSLFHRWDELAKNASCKPTSSYSDNTYTRPFHALFNDRADILTEDIDEDLNSDINAI